MQKHVDVSDYIGDFASSPIAPWRDMSPWQMTVQISSIVRELFSVLSPEEFVVTDEIAIHRSATVESGAVLKGPLILGAGCFVAAGAYLRGGNWVAANSTFGPGSELKSSLVFSGTKLAHFNFVGDSIVGSNVNFEAGAIVCNYRNERVDKEIRVRVGTGSTGIGVTKFGALIGDDTRIGANAVIAPGALLAAGTIIRRTQLLDHDFSDEQKHG
jgi:UDP-N-acetylglucosamine diphosphorylase / glucose-1-phosphate thymidylyltransferase / UDP-N-acetylgalactosamine diphosphorylase / glucosamine-1-phosphate N-acetyltransferase / galactosamine-1-phosphate N-acetyltransferase